MLSSVIESHNSIGLCLCGGGARGIAHAGVLYALEEHGIIPDYLSGASMGAIVGAFYAEGLAPFDILEILSKPRFFKAFTITFPNEGLTDLTYLKRMLRSNIQSDNFEDLKKKLFVCVSNLNSGKYEIIQSGKLSTAILASSAIPLIFKPVRIDDQLYVDGGLLNNLPVEPLLEHCQMIIGVNVNQYGEEPNKIEGIWAIGERCANLIIAENARSRFTLCDVVIDVESAYSFGIFDFKSAEKIFEAGYQQTLDLIPQIQAKIVEKSKKKNSYKFWQIQAKPIGFNPQN
jgi:NTE family protein